MKGCVRGYGNYEELTSSGVDPTELFDDIEDSIKSPDLVPPDLVPPDIVIEESDNVVEEADKRNTKSPDHVHLLPPIEKPRGCVTLKHSASNPCLSLDPNFDGLPEEISLFTAPSLFSLVSTHDNLDSIRGTKKVRLLLYSYKFSRDLNFMNFVDETCLVKSSLYILLIIQLQALKMKSRKFLKLATI